MTADDVFYYVYGVLHAPDYSSTFAADLKKMLPRIPKVASPVEFVAAAVVDAGRALTELHIGYESVDPFPLTEEMKGPDSAAA